MPARGIPARHNRAVTYEDAFRRRTTDLPGLLRAAGEVLRRSRHVPGVLDGRGLDPGLREQVMLAVTEVNACRWCAYVHEGLAVAVGDPTGPASRVDAALDYARQVAAAGGRPVPPSAREALRAHFDDAEVAALDLTVAAITVGNLAGNTVDSLLARLGGRLPLNLRALARELAVAAVAVPAGLPVVAAAGLLRRVSAARRPPSA